MKRFKYGDIVQLNNEGLETCGPITAVAAMTGSVQFYEEGTGLVVVLLNSGAHRKYPEAWLDLLFD